MAVAGIEPGESRWILPLGGAVGFCLGIFFIRGLHRFFFFFLGSAVGLALGQGAFEWLRTGTTAFSDATALWHGVFIVVGTVVGGVAMARGSRWLVMGSRRSPARYLCRWRFAIRWHYSPRRLWLSRRSFCRRDY